MKTIEVRIEQQDEFYEFHITWRNDTPDPAYHTTPDFRFYWHGRACCKWEAKAKGWNSWKTTHGTT